MRWFVLGQSAEVIAQEARLERKRVLRALIVVRQAMVRDVPHVFSGVVEVDETYLGGSWRNRRLAKRVQGTKRGRGTTKPESTEGGRLVSILKWPEGAPLNLG